MSTTKKNIIKEGIQNFKYELMFVKHKLDLVETLISGLEEKVYSDEPISELDERLMNAKVKLLMDEYEKLHSMIKPEKVKFQSQDNFETA
jgi:hypothetical protein